MARFLQRDIQEDASYWIQHMASYARRPLRNPDPSVYCVFTIAMGYILTIEISNRKGEMRYVY